MNNEIICPYCSKICTPRCKYTYIESCSVVELCGYCHKTFMIDVQVQITNNYLTRRADCLSDGNHSLNISKHRWKKGFYAKCIDCGLTLSYASKEMCIEFGATEKDFTTLASSEG